MTRVAEHGKQTFAVVAAGGNMGVIDPGAALLPQKFYRVRLVVPE
jgi:hypothetical protein